MEALIFFAFIFFTLGAACGIYAAKNIAALKESVESLKEKVNKLEQRLLRVTGKVPPEKPEVRIEKPDVAKVLAQRRDAALETSSERTFGEKLTFFDSESVRRLEEKIGRNWMAWAGACALFVAAAFFLKYAFDQGWLGPWVRVGCGVLFGLGLLAGGEVAVKRGLRIFGLSLVGCALSVLYVVFYSTHRYYELIGANTCFILMLAVTVVGVLSALRHNAYSISFFSFTSGFITPVLISTGKDPRDLLFSYLILLNAAIIGISYAKKWRFLDLVTLIGTWVLYTGWSIRFYREEALFAALLWACFFYPVSYTHLTLPTKA